jgi:hypothetical protein
MTKNEPVKKGSVIRYRKVNFIVDDVCKSCQLVWFSRIIWVPYKKKKGNKPTIESHRASYFQVEFIAE